ncbi:MAG: KpsF/GutQ family sugar-phosphate isomerase [Gammaproteobacteria bacterium]|nr:KpsF/GutQ family sugar-phosphate isomerase [Gammaproteobacteria bacterium]MYI22383.1 KpsF/GutQ family sugar-phosphate isomerase [Gammaproteobacteria bacterium]
MPGAMTSPPKTRAAERADAGGTPARSPSLSGKDADAAASAIAEAARVLRAEGSALLHLADRIGQPFVKAVDTVLAASGRIIVSGIGKSGIVARKIASTLTFTGTSASFLHPVEGLHGDLGIVSREDVAILVSKSGDTEELVELAGYLLRYGVPIVLMTGNPRSQLVRHATALLDCSVAEEACPVDLAPTTSTTAAMAMGDALAIVLLRRRGIEPADLFARLHPGGTLGRRLTLLVEDVMVREGYPSLLQDALVRDSIVPLARMRGTVPIVDGQDRVVGVVTAGDLTRLMEREPDFLHIPIRAIMSPEPRLARLGTLASASAREMEQHGIMALPVVDGKDRLRGVVHLHDLMRSGVL